MARQHMHALLLLAVGVTHAFFLPAPLLPGRLPLQQHQQHLHERPTQTEGHGRHAPLRMSTTMAPPEKDTNAETVMWLRGLTNTFDGQR